MEQQLVVKKGDLFMIGYSAYEGTNNCLNIICRSENANIEKILLRSILSCWGDFHIVKEEDYPWTDPEIVTDILYVTDLPYDLYINYKTTDKQ